MSTNPAQSYTGPGLLQWGLRTYATLIVACIALVTVALPLAMQARATDTYEARALVVAQSWELPLAALPPYGEAVFANGVVASETADALALPGDPAQLVPDTLSVSTAQDSPVMAVTGRSSDPAVATRLANEGARVFVSELNAPGAGLGSFVWQRAATVPPDPLPATTGGVVALVVGVFSGAVLGLGLLGLVLTVRKPIVDPAALEALAGAPVLGVLSLPKRVRTALAPRRVAGLGPVLRRLADVPFPLLHVVAASQDAGQRRVVASILAAGLSQWRPVVLASGAGRTRPALAPPGGPQPLAVVDIEWPLDTGPETAEAGTVLVVREGTPERAVLIALAEHCDARFVGVVMVRRGSLIRASTPSVAPAAPSDQQPAASPTS